MRQQAGGTAGTGSVPAVSRVDFRRPTGFTRDAVRKLAAVHELLARRVSTGWGTQLRSVVHLEEIGVDQATYDEYVASMPSPNVLSIVDVDPLPAPVLVELNTQLALTLVDRLLGGIGEPPSGTARRLTEVETALLGQLLRDVVEGIEEALAGHGSAGASLRAIEYNPQLVQVAAPSAPVVSLTYRVTISQGIATEGLLTVCYPTGAATPLLGELATEDGQVPPAGTSATGPDHRLAERLEHAVTEVRGRLRPTAVRARDLHAIQPGDVLRLSHRVDEPVDVLMGDTEVATAHIGRRGRRLALQFTGAPSGIEHGADAVPPGDVHPPTKDAQP